jgi:hypothetical protein
MRHLHTEEEIEGLAERRIDRLDEKLMSNQLTQADEDARWSDLSDLLHAIESLPGVAALEQIGDIDHENGRGWTYEVTLA